MHRESSAVSGYTCPICGVSFTRYRSAVEVEAPVCGRICQGIQRTRRAGYGVRVGQYRCAVCGKPFTRYRCHVRVSHPVCSNRCAGLVQRARITLAQRLLDRTSPRPDASGCLLWIGTQDQRGYGLLHYKDGGRQRQLRASRCVVMLALGAETYEDVRLLPSWLDVCHTCDNPPCVNPEHLFIAPREMNMHDKVMKGRARKCHLTEGDVRAIREAYQPGVETQYSLARRFGVSQNTIGRIVHRLTWRHVD